MNEKNMTTRYHGHKGNKKNAKHEKLMKCMQKEHYLSWGTEGGVEEDVDRSTMYRGNRRLRKEAWRVGVVSRCLKHEFSCKCNMKHMQ